MQDDPGLRLGSKSEHGPTVPYNSQSGVLDVPLGEAPNSPHGPRHYHPLSYSFSRYSAGGYRSSDGDNILGIKTRRPWKAISL